jgi:isoleucyl-tRNA synthetase
LLEAKPSFRALGKRFGKATPAAAAAIAALASADVARFEAGERVTVTVQGSEVALEPGDLTVTRHARGELVVQSDGEVVAALDPVLTDALRAEGLAREVVSRVQRLRKEAGLAVGDRIALWVDGDPAVVRAAGVHRGYISGETLAVAFVVGPPAEAGAVVEQTLELDGRTARIALRRTG